MNYDFNFKRVGETHLFQSESYLITKEELKYIFESQIVSGGNIRTMIANHEIIPLEQSRKS